MTLENIKINQVKNMNGIARRMTSDQATKITNKRKLEVAKLVAAAIDQIVLAESLDQVQKAVNTVYNTKL